MVIYIHNEVASIEKAIKRLEYFASTIERDATNNFEKSVSRDLRENCRRLNGELMRLISTAEAAKKGHFNIIN